MKIYFLQVDAIGALRCEYNLQVLTRLVSSVQNLENPWLADKYKDKH